MSAQIDAKEAQYAQLLQNDPQAQALFAQLKQLPPAATKGPGDRARAEIAGQFVARGKVLGIPADYLPENKNGQIVVDHQNWFEQHPAMTALMIAGGLVGGIGLAGGLTGAAGSGAAAGSSAPAAAASGSSFITAPAANAGLVSAGSGAAIGPGEAAGALAPAVTPSAAIAGGAAAAPAAAGGSAWMRALTQLAPAGAQAGLALYNQNQTGKAIQSANASQQAATNQALQLQKGAARTAGQNYLQQRSDMANLFGTPFASLGSLLGIQTQPIDPGTAVVNASTNSLPATGAAPGSGLTSGPLTPPMTLKQLQAIGAR